MSILRRSRVGHGRLGGGLNLRAEAARYHAEAAQVETDAKTAVNASPAQN